MDKNPEDFSPTPGSTLGSAPGSTTGSTFGSTLGFTHDSTLGLTHDSTHNVRMQRCLDLALLGAGKVSPNPMVGALVVFEGNIIGEGWHRQYGGPHAEVHAIGEALDFAHKRYPELEIGPRNILLEQCILYVSLEPCSHYGKTPPCTELIIFHKIPVVVVGCLDPHVLVSGRGQQALVAAGVKVYVGVLEKEATFINRRFFTAVGKKRPYIILKWAETADGFMAPDPYRPYWISSPLSRRLSHRWRTEEDGILVGAHTAILDQPQLTARYWSGKNPLRILMDWNLSVPLSSPLFHAEGKTIVFHGDRSSPTLPPPPELGQSSMLQYIALEEREYFVQYVLYNLHLLDIQSVLVEGGRKTLDLFLKYDLWDEIRVIQSGDRWDKGGIQAPALPASATIGSHIYLGNDCVKTIFPSDKG